jgi:hypothetical protein
MADRDRIPPATRAKLQGLGIDDDTINLFSPEEAEKYSRNFTREEMQKILNGGRVPPKPDEGEQFLAAFGSDTPSAPEPNGEPARDNQEREEAPTIGAESFAPEGADSNDAPPSTSETDKEPPPEPEQAQQGIPFVMTHAMKAALHAHGKPDDEIDRMTPTQGYEFLKANGGWPPESRSPVPAAPVAPEANDLPDFTESVVPEILKPNGGPPCESPNIASDIDTRTVAVTFFPNKSAQSQHCIDLTLPQLAEQIRLKTGPSKLELPWLKLAIFGDKRSSKNCIRTNANTKEITGIEVEHDKGEITFDTAIATLRTASLRALLYTSPSYVPVAKERWRILLPLSGKAPPDMRALLVARVNGLLDGKLSGESFVLSQAYLYGSVNNNPAHRVEVIDGDFIDRRTDLDAGAIGKEPTDKDARAIIGGQQEEDRGTPSRTDAEIMALLALSQREGEWHNAILSATASMVGRGWTDDRIYKTCAPYCWGGEDDPDVEEMVEGARTKWNIPDGITAQRLARLTLIEYEQQRKQAAKALGVRVTALDNMVGACRAGNQAKEVDSEIAEINTDYALVLAGNKAAVMKFEDKTKFRLLQVSAFKQWFANQFITIGNKSVALGDYWLSHPQRRQYGGIEFAPPGTAAHAGHYNLWQGFAVEPRAGDCSKFLTHLKDNVAQGDEKTFLWIVGWWAQIFQQPSIKMETALVVRGPFGAGKTKVGEVMGSLIGDHYLLVSHKRHITGQFNSHMASLIVLHPDEAFWAGDKESVGTVRDLVSGKTYRLEYKGVDVIIIKSFVRLYVSGNPDWVVPAGFRERRWAVFDIGTDHLQDHPYFAAIDHEMDNGGREALLHYLLNFDLSQVNLRVIPKTAALLDQQIETMTSEQTWWLETLKAGVLPPSPLDDGERCVCKRDDLFARYILHARIQGVNYRSTETKIGIFLDKQLGGKLQHIRPFIEREDQRVRCYRLPPLVDCRRLFSQELGQPIDWGAGWEEEDWQHQASAEVPLMWRVIREPR